MWCTRMNISRLFLERKGFRWVHLGYKWLESFTMPLGKMDQTEGVLFSKRNTDKWASRRLVPVGLAGGWCPPGGTEDAVTVPWTLHCTTPLPSESKAIHCQNSLVLVSCSPSNLLAWFWLARYVRLQQELLSVPILTGTGVMVCGIN